MKRRQDNFKNLEKWPALGCGVGLRNEHYGEVLSQRPKVDWFEAISENFMDTGGRPVRILEKVRENYPVVLHGTSLSVGSWDDLDKTYLARLKILIERIEPAMVSDHLCWGGIDGQRLYDLLPLPYTEEAIQHIVERVQRVQDFLGRRILLENVSTYLSYKHSEMPEWEFIKQVAERSGCGLLIDLNNIYVNAFNHQFDPLEYLDAIPGELVGQFHLAGHTDKGSYLFDTHTGHVISKVWDLYREALERWGKISTLIEWDEEIPALPELLDEAEKARVYYDQASDSWRGTKVKDRSEKALPASVTGSPTLLETERWFRSRIHPVKSSQETGLPRVALNLQRETPGEERLKVYAGGYFARIHAALKEAYETVCHLLGENLFMRLAEDYARTVPSQDYNLSMAGKNLPDFLRDWGKTKDLPFLPDLAEMEWKITRSFHAFDRQPLEVSKLAGLKESDWNDLKIIFQPSFILYASDWPVWDLWQARRTPVKKIKIDLIHRPQKVEISRPNGDTEVVCELVSAEEFELALDLMNQKSLGEIMESRVLSEREETLNVQEIFSRWMNRGLIADFELARTSKIR